MLGWGRVDGVRAALDGTRRSRAISAGVHAIAPASDAIARAWRASIRCKREAHERERLSLLSAGCRPGAERDLPRALGRAVATGGALADRGGGPRKRSVLPGLHGRDRAAPCDR